MFEEELEKYINAAFCREKTGIEEITIEDLKQAFQDGYDMANEWHFVKDGDLPKNEGFVCNQDGLPCWFDIETEQWLDCDGTQIRTTEWCEMPRFKEVAE